jgi:GNAT superfamily N-acetyltransferase
MVLSEDLIGKGFSMQNVDKQDVEKYIDIKRICHKKYVDEYNDGWIEDIQTIINTDSFHRMLKYSCFQKILLYGTAVGFFAYNEQPDKIGEISLLLTESARKKGIEAFYLGHITALSGQVSKPIFLYVYKTDPVQDLYKQFGFKIYDQSRTHYLMSFNQDHTNDINNAIGIRNHINRILIKES